MGGRGLRLKGAGLNLRKGFRLDLRPAGPKDAGGSDLLTGSGALRSWVLSSRARGNHKPGEGEGLPVVVSLLLLLLRVSCLWLVAILLLVLLLVLLMLLLVLLGAVTILVIGLVGLLLLLLLVLERLLPGLVP